MDWITSDNEEPSLGKDNYSSASSTCHGTLKVSHKLVVDSMLRNLTAPDGIFGCNFRLARYILDSHAEKLTSRALGSLLVVASKPASYLLDCA